MQAFQRPAALAAAAFLSSFIAAAELARATTVSMLWTGASSAGPVAGVGTDGGVRSRRTRDEPACGAERWG